MKVLAEADAEQAGAGPAEDEREAAWEPAPAERASALGADTVNRINGGSPVTRSNALNVVSPMIRE